MAKAHKSRSRGEYLTRSGFQITDPDGREVIKLALEHQFSVSKVAEALGLKVFQFKAELERIVGLGPKEYFRHYRAVSARWLLSDGVPLREISKILGFRHYTHFAAEVRAFYKISPRELKRDIDRRTPRSKPLPPASEDDGEGAA